MISPPVESSPVSVHTTIHPRRAIPAHRKRAMYRAVTQRYRLTRIPFFLDGVAASSLLNQANGIHPTGEGYRLIVEKVFPALEPVLERNR